MCGLFLIDMNICCAPYLEISPKCLAMAPMTLSSLCLLSGCMLLWTSDCNLTQRVLNIHRSAYGAVWMLYGWCHVKLLTSTQVPCTPYSHAPVYSVTLFEATYVGCMYVPCKMWSYNYVRIISYRYEHLLSALSVCLAVTCHLHFWQNGRDFYVQLGNIVVKRIPE